MKKIVIAVCLSILCFSTQIAAKPLELVTLQYPPYEYEEYDKVKGIAVEIVREAFQRMQQPITIQLLPWARAIRRVQQGKADAIFTAYKTPEREQFADYSKEVLMPQVVSLFVLKDSPVEWNGDLETLKQYQIGAVRKVSYGQRFDEALKNKVLPRIQLASTGEQNIEKLLKKRFSILISNKYGALDILKKMGKLDAVRELSPEVQSVPSYLAFSKKRNLVSIRDQFDAVLAEMKRDGTYDKIISSYF